MARNLKQAAAKRFVNRDAPFISDSNLCGSGIIGFVLSGRCENFER